MIAKAEKKDELVKAGAPDKTASIIANKAERGDAPIPNAHPVAEDKRETAREEHKFTSRADSKGQ